MILLSHPVCNITKQDHINMCITDFNTRRVILLVYLLILLFIYFIPIGMLLNRLFVWDPSDLSIKDRISWDNPLDHFLRSSPAGDSVWLSLCWVLDKITYLQSNDHGMCQAQSCINTGLNLIFTSNVSRAPGTTATRPQEHHGCSGLVKMPPN